MKKTLIIGGIFAACVALAWGAIVNGFSDYTVLGSAPGNPASGFARLYATASGFGCKTSAGASCLTTGGGGTSIFTGNQNPNGGGVDVAPHTMTANNLPAPYVASSSSVFFSQQPYLAFDGNVATTWSPNATTGILVMDLGPIGAQTVQNYSVQVTTPLQAGREPKDWTFQGSNDNSTWTTLDTETNQTGWTAAQIRNYTISSPALYRYYRINISANNGGSTIVLVAEMYMFTASASAVTSGTTGDWYYETDGTKRVYGPKTNPSTWPLFGTMQ